MALCRLHSKLLLSNAVYTCLLSPLIHSFIHKHVSNKTCEHQALLGHKMVPARENGGGGGGVAQADAAGGERLTSATEGAELPWRRG